MQAQIPIQLAFIKNLKKICPAPLALFHLGHKDGLFSQLTQFLLCSLNWNEVANLNTIYEAITESYLSTSERISNNLNLNKWALQARLHLKLVPTIWI